MISCNIGCMVIFSCFHTVHSQLLLFWLAKAWGRRACGGGIMIHGSEQYLDENKQLILAILDNQNQGRLNECAM